MLRALALVLVMGVCSLWTATVTAQNPPPARGEIPAQFMPAPEDLLRLLVLHGGKHVWERIAWLADVADLLRQHPDLDHAVVAQTARRKT